MGVALVTGGGRGIGAAVSLKLAQDGYDVMLTYNTSSKSAELVVEEIRAMGKDAVALNCDCEDSREIALMGTHPWFQNGLDILVLNHGRYDRVLAEQLSINQLRKTMSVNFEGSFLVWDTVQQYLHDDARIIVIGSQLGTRGSPQGADYAASKAALEIWSKSLAMRVGQKGQRVNIVAPGFVDTDILAGDSVEKRKFRESIVPLARIGTPEDIAHTVSFLASENSSYVTGAVIHINGGLYLPR